MWQSLSFPEGQTYHFLYGFFYDFPIFLWLFHAFPMIFRVPGASFEAPGSTSTRGRVTAGPLPRLGAVPADAGAVLRARRGCPGEDPRWGTGRGMMLEYMRR